MKQFGINDDQVVDYDLTNIAGCKAFIESKQVHFNSIVESYDFGQFSLLR
jgi:hypothetical protein